VGGEGGQPDLVVGALELPRRDRECASEHREGQGSAVAALDGDLGADVQVRHELDGAFAMSGGVCTTVRRSHSVLSDKVAPVGTPAAAERRRRGQHNDR
jgi:hypothetical protein